MSILGIDPGYAIVGYGVVDAVANRMVPVTFGVITTEPGVRFEHRVKLIYERVSVLMEQLKPEWLAIEKLYFATNRTTAIDVAQARGVVLLAAANHGIPVAEYTPLQVKKAVAGYGQAEKAQVMEMTRQILGLDAVPKPDDAADALAVAICHWNTSRSLMSEYALDAYPKP